jgi:hypothetical protein
VDGERTFTMKTRALSLDPGVVSFDDCKRTEPQTTASFGQLSDEKLWGGLAMVLREKGGERLQRGWALYSRAWLGRQARVCEGGLGSDGGGSCRAQDGLARTTTPSDKRAWLVSGSVQLGGVPLRCSG